VDFFIKWKGHFSFWCSALNRVGGEAKRIPSRHSVHSSETHRTPFGVRLVSLAFPLFRSALTLTAFSILVLFARDFFFGMVLWGLGGFPLRRKLTEFNAVMLRLVSFH
jgi:hypothetical protein